MSQTHSTSKTTAWIESLRPRTLPLALASIVTGSALAAWMNHFQLDIALMALLTAGLLQILSNLANDYGDAIKGSDTETRIGPNRGMQKGLINLAQMKRALIIVIVLTVASGIGLIAIACKKPEDILGFLALGLMAIVASITYTVGRKPYGYMGLGDISVLIFFGWLSVAGTYYLQAGTFDSVVMLPATACGLLATAVLNINNLRDIDSDRMNGKKHPCGSFRPTVGAPLSLYAAVRCAIMLNSFCAVRSAQFGWVGYLFWPFRYSIATLCMFCMNLQRSRCARC
ncbi:1,4-dihydroxy-2-naphthoate polyprenyltransferase [Budvicia aquatica]|uniref:1,4-dihydroxy-2-naphthoate octaprenyltransferase n=1 Tax=Budvicia aquatica TaxID=82979 RepID=A0A484ZG03_9GAMM|nr:1,4-dihydroxy-2-naphthoate polyprenyltransferase [Budvicia aquatica]VFS46581.1 1,4-dihydroxy-2-naphthoate octaprenyltransferase [Budvicia aquatica]